MAAAAVLTDCVGRRTEAGSGLSSGRPDSGADQGAAYLNPDLPFETRANDLVGRMTVDEKISQLTHDAAAIPRLGIPEYNWWNECLHGVARAGLATVFPQAIGMAASFDVPLMGQVATVISDEARAKYHEFVRAGQRGVFEGLTFWSPNINLFRDPRWGRGQETYGEDPFLTARMGVAFVKGLQGDDPKYYKVIATAKHYAVHSGPEPERHRFDARVDERDLHETYLPAFRALVEEAKVASVMGAYNRVDGEAASASQRLLGDILRAEWHFGGYVVSDCGAIEDIYRNHKIVSTPVEAAALGLRRGCDLECGFDSAYRKLGDALTKGLVTESDIDVAVRRLMLARLKLGLFDPPERVSYAQIPYSVNLAPEHDDLARRMAQASIVLLKNTGVLPLRKDLKTIAVIGPNADALPPLLGNYFGTPAKPVTVLAGIRAAVPGTRVLYARGSFLVEGRTDPSAVVAIAEALDVARAADAIVFVGGLSPEVEGEELPVSFPGFLGGDRTDIALPAPQEKVLEALHATGKPVVLVLMAGSAVAVNWAKDNLPGIVVAWYPGQHGDAVADVLFGDANPAGRLPVTFYKGVEQLPPFTEYAMKERTYRYFTGEPLYPFGHGLSYTRFAYSDLHLAASSVAADDAVHVSVRVKNTGDRDGEEVVQLYVRDLHPSQPMPLKALRAFSRIRLARGEQKTVDFELRPTRDFAHYDTTRKADAVEPGEFEIQVGASSRDIRLQEHLQVR